MPYDDDQLLTEKQAADWLGMQPQTLRIWRSTGRVELPFCTLGRSVRYRAGDVRQFIETHTVSHTH